MTFPSPPLSAQPLDLVHAESAWVRLHSVRFDPIFFGRSGTYRFDSPAKDYGVLYLADTLETAVLETLVRLPAEGAGAADRDVPLQVLQERAVTLFAPTRPLRLVSLVGAHLRRQGLDGRIFTDLNYSQHSQVWSHFFHQHPEQPDGILFPSRHNPDLRCCAIFERARDALVPAAAPWPPRTGLADPRVLEQLALIFEKYEVGVGD